MTARISRKWRFAACVTAGVTAIAITAVAPGATAATARRPLPGSSPQWVRQAHKLGSPAKDAAVDFGVLLALRNESGAQAALQNLSSPSSASYGKWLTNAQFNDRYAPARADVAAVQRWLKAQGFAVTKTVPSGQLVEARGTSAQIEKTFNTTLANFAFRGKTVRSNATPLSLPSDAPAAIHGILGIDQGSALKQPAEHRAGSGAGRAVRRPALLAVLRAAHRQRQARRVRAEAALRRSAGTARSSTRRRTARAD